MFAYLFLFKWMGRLHLVLLNNPTKLFSRDKVREDNLVPMMAT